MAELQSIPVLTLVLLVDVLDKQVAIHHSDSHGRMILLHQYGLRLVHQIMDDPAVILLAVLEKKSGKLMGNASLQNIDLINRHCNVAITLGERDLASISTGVEVFALLAQHAFKRLNLHRIEDACHEKLMGLSSLVY